MKQKVVIQVLLKDQRSCTKAITTAVGVDGVIGATLQQEKDLIEVTGEGIDVVCLTNLLRKRLKYACVKTVSLVEEKPPVKPEVKPEEKPIMCYCQPFMCHCGTSVSYYQAISIPENYCHQDPFCTIL